MKIEQVSESGEDLYLAFQRLVPQLTTNNLPPSRADLEALVRSENSVLFIAQGEDGQIIGAACLTVYRVPTGLRAVIEDVIVDESARGQGVGEVLVRRALEAAQARGASGVTLTSNPRREAANRLYRRMGFKLRETNAYVYKF